jgi:ubiquinone/menaquinone biosynthesis C-methylase UbiE
MFLLRKLHLQIVGAQIWKLVMSKNYSKSLDRIIFGFFILLISPISFLNAAGETANPNVNFLKIIITRNYQQIAIEPKDFEDFQFQTGDRLYILPKFQADKLTKSVDGHSHILVSEGRSIRIPPVYILTEHKGYSMPEHLCVLTGVGSEGFDSIGKMHMESYAKYMGLWPEMTFLEIGCGIGRDVFQLLEILNDSGRYIGIDVTRDSVLWLQKNITVSHPNFKFYHFDVNHQIYNPLGTKNSSDFALPAEDHSVDRMSIGSVFTHLFEEEIIHYLKEIKRVLKSGGMAYATFFLYSDDAVMASRANSITPFKLRFEHPNGNGCFVNDPFYKTGAVAYTEESILRMIKKAGLELAYPLIRGGWSGLFEGCDDGQDVAILINSESEGE